MDLAWDEDEVVLLSFAFKSSAKIPKMHIFNEHFRPVRNCVLKLKEHPRTLAILRRNIAAIGYTFIGTIEFWNTQTLSCLYVLRAHSASINTIHFSQDATQMFSVSENRSIKIWNLQKIQQIQDSQTGSQGQLEVSEVSKVKETRDLFVELANHEEFAVNVHQLEVLASGQDVILSFAEKSPIIVNLAKNLERKVFENPQNSG